MELERTAQEAFYNGLCEEYKPIVVHMLENPGVTVGDLVEAVRKVESIQERRRIQHRMLPVMRCQQVITSPRSKRTKVRIRTGGMTEEILRVPLELK